MNAEINELKKVIDTTQKDDTPWVAGKIEKFGNEITSILSAPANLVGNIVKGISSLLKKN